MESRSVLLKVGGMAGILGRGGAEKTKTGYTNQSLNNFRKRMMEEERRSEAPGMKHNDLTRKGTTQAGAGDALEKRISYEKLPQMDKAIRS